MSTPHGSVLPRMQSLVAEVGSLRPDQVPAWHERARLAVAAAYGDPSSNLERFDGIWYSPGVLTTQTPESVFDQAALDGALTAASMLAAFMEDLAATARPSSSAGPRSEDPAAVMVIHGQDHEAARALFDWLRAIGLRPLEWAQLIRATEAGSPFIGQVLESAFAKAQAVVALFTPDERVATREELTGRAAAWRLQSRPNVVFEAGMSFATHPDRTILALLDEQDVASDLAGRHFVRLDSAAALKELAQRLETAGCPVDLSGQHWLDFERFPQRHPIDAAPALSVSPTSELRPALSAVLAAHGSLMQTFSGSHVLEREVKDERRRLEQALADLLVAAPETVARAAARLRDAWRPRVNRLYMGPPGWEDEVEAARTDLLTAVRGADPNL